MVANLLSALLAFFLEVVLMGIGTVLGLLGRRRNPWWNHSAQAGDAEEGGGVD